MSDGKDQIGDENQLQPNEGLLRSINTVTPLSKYLAMVLFILLPFIGGWIGYTHALERVVEKVVVVNAQRAIFQDEEINDEWKTYRNEEYGFEFDYPAHIWKLQPHTDEDSTYFSFYNYTDDMGTKVFNINFSGETDITSGAKLITQWNQGLNESTRSYMLVSEYENDQSDYGTYYRTVIDIFSDNELVASIDYTRRPNDQKDEIYNKVVNSIEIKPTEVEQ